MNQKLRHTLWLHSAFRDSILSNKPDLRTQVFPISPPYILLIHRLSNRESVREILMNKKDKIILKDLGILVVDNLIKFISIPGLHIPWDFSKVLLEAPMKFRQQNALEWVEILRDNPSVFTEDILASKVFQDGFVVVLESYLKERSEDKRMITKNVFLGFAKSTDKVEFPLERNIHTLSQLSAKDISTLKDYTKSPTDFRFEPNNLPLLSNLQLLGILEGELGPESRTHPTSNISSFGLDFIEFLVS